MNKEKFNKTLATAATVSVVPAHVLGGPGKKAPSDKLNIACVGIGGKGFWDSEAMKGENVIALCDVDEQKAAEMVGGENQEKRNAFTNFPNAKFYKDFRVMLDKEKDIEAITVSTPDHTHANIALEAMRRGIHVYVQKPLTHTVEEARLLRKAAKKYKVVTQMGNQGHSGENQRRVCEWIWDGAIGEVSEVHTWTNRPIWPQGMNAPTTTPATPPTLDWDLWLGPAQWRPYHPAYAPFVWRGWWDFGTGALGDMGAHIIDVPYWALNLGYPEKIQACSSHFNKHAYPLTSIVTYDFPEREGFPACRMYWYDGGLKAGRPADIEDARLMGNWSGGVIFKGSKGNLVCGSAADNPRIVPETKMKDYLRELKERGGLKKTLERSPGQYEEWLQAIKDNKPEDSKANFEYAVPLCEMMLLGCVAIKYAHKNNILDYDGKKGRVTNDAEANSALSKEYRRGWELPKV